MNRYTDSLLETLADISYLAGNDKYYSADSRADINNFIWWAKQFEDLHKKTNWDSVDYMTTIEAFANEKFRMKLEESIS